MINKQVDIQAKFFRGLGDQSRLTILETVLDRPKTVSEIVKLTKLSQPNTSLHLSCLLECGLVTKIKKGREVFYKASMKDISNLISIAKRVIKKHSKEMYKCTHYIILIAAITAFTAFCTVRAKAHCLSCIVYCHHCNCHVN